MIIPLMDVKRQYESIKEELDNKALSILSSGKYILGDEVSKFENKFAKYIGTKYAIGVGNGTDALVIALLACGIKKDDEVITTAMSFFATSEAITIIGAKPVFVDCTFDTYNIDVKQIENKISNKTKAILPVHLYGQCCDIENICAIAKKYNLKVIEDTAQAAGATYKNKKAGSFGDVSCISFFPTKTLGCCGDGGIILTSDLDIYKRCMAYRVHGSGDNGRYVYCKDNNIEYNEKFDYQDNQPKYYNYVLGYNSRLDALQAGILNIKLDYLDKWNDKRVEHAKHYNEKINNKLIVKPFVADKNKHIYYVYVIQVNDRKKFVEYLKEKNIASGVYFPVPLHLQKVFNYLGYKKGDMPNSEYISEHGVAIPMFPELTLDEINSVVDVINSYHE